MKKLSLIMIFFLVTISIFALADDLFFGTASVDDRIQNLRERVERLELDIMSLTTENYVLENKIDTLESRISIFELSNF